MRAGSDAGAAPGLVPKTGPKWFSLIDLRNISRNTAATSPCQHMLAVFQASPSCRSAMRIVFGVLPYLAVALAVVSGSAAFVVFAFHPALVMVAAQQETPKVAPRVSGVAGQKAEKERAAALAEKGQAEKFRMSIVSTAADAAMARASDNDAARERGAGANERAQREPRRRSRQPEQKAQTAHGYAPESRWSSNPVRLHG